MVSRQYNLRPTLEHPSFPANPPPQLNRGNPLLQDPLPADVTPLHYYRWSGHCHGNRAAAHLNLQSASPTLPSTWLVLYRMCGHLHRSGRFSYHGVFLHFNSKYVMVSRDY